MGGPEAEGGDAAPRWSGEEATSLRVEGEGAAAAGVGAAAAGVGAGERAAGLGLGRTGVGPVDL